MLKTLILFLLMTLVSSAGLTQSGKQIDLSQALQHTFSIFESGSSKQWIISNPDLYITPSGKILYLGAEGTDYKVIPADGSWVETDLSQVTPGSLTPRFLPSRGLNENRSSKQIGLIEGTKLVLCKQFTIGKDTFQDVKPAIKLTKSNQTGTLSEFSSGRWVRYSLSEGGVYKVAASDLKKAGFTEQHDQRNLAVYSSSGYNPYLSGTNELPLLAEKSETGVWDNDQVWYFYTETTKGLVFNSKKNAVTFYDDQFSNVHFIYVGFKSSPGARMAQVDGETLANAEEVTSAKYMVWDNQDYENILKSGEAFYSQRISANSSMVFTKKLPDYKTGTPVSLSSSVIVQYVYPVLAKMSILESGRYIVKDIITGSSNPSNYSDKVARERTVSGIIPSLTEDRASVDFSLVSVGPSVGWVDWFTLEYQKNLLLPKTKADFYFSGQTTDKQVNIKLSGFENSSLIALNTSDIFQPKAISSVNIMGGDLRFGWTLKSGTPNRFYVFNKNTGVTSVGSLPSETIQTPELGTAFLSGVNYVIVAPKAFAPAVKRLLSHREKQGWRGSAAWLEDIYLVYSGGKQNGPAIKSFLSDVYNSGGEKLQNVLLFGDASYDVKGIGGTKPFPGIIPTIESTESLDLDYTHCSDDDYSQLSVQDQYSAGVGRLPVSNLTEAEGMVDKLINYDLGSDQGDWRSLVTMIADDGLTSTGDDGDLHTSNAETVASIIPSYLSQRKIYTVSYPSITTSNGRRKPEAGNAILDLFNQGSAVVNYSGHGNTKVWTHERVFEIGTFLPRLNNKNRLPFLITATCDFGKFDDPDDQSAAELLVTHKESGVAGIFTTTRLVYTDKQIIGKNNLALNYYLFTYLYQKNENGKNLSLGEIFVKTKRKLADFDSVQNKYKGDENVRKFALLADPAMRLVIPEGTGFLEKNDTLLDASKSVRFTTMEENLISGKITGLQGEPDLSFNGTCFIRLKAEPVLVSVPEWKNRPFTDVPSYLSEGPDIFRGLVTVTAGKFSLKFLAPRDVLPNNYPTRLSGYFWNADRNGLLVSPEVYYLAGNTTSKPDSLPPAVFLYVNDSTFTNGQKVSPASILYASISDESGINTTGLGIGHQLSGVFNNDISAPVDFSQFYTAEKDNYKKGRIEYPIRSLSEGDYTFRLKVWDAFNNGAESELRFTVTNESKLAVENLYPYPNPFSDKVKFFFNHNQNQTDLQVTLSIFTINGLLIRTLKQNFSGSSAGEAIEWDGKDQDGDKIANGIYIAKTKIKDLRSGKTESKISKLLKYN